MAKKKVDSIFLGGVETKIPNTTPIPVQVPPYEDMGIRYKGYYKVQKSSNEWLLKKQDTRHFAHYAQGNGADQTFTSSKSFAGTFYSSTIIISVKTTINTELILYDTNTSNSRMGTYLPAGNYVLVIPIRDCPRKWAGDFIISTGTATLPVGDLIYIEHLGWTEEI